VVTPNVLFFFFSFFVGLLFLTHPQKKINQPLNFFFFFFKSCGFEILVIFSFSYRLKFNLHLKIKIFQNIMSSHWRNSSQKKMLLWTCCNTRLWPSYISYKSWTYDKQYERKWGATGNMVGNTLRTSWEHIKNNPKNQLPHPHPPPNEKKT